MATWDLHARLEGRPLCEVLGASRAADRGRRVDRHPAVDRRRSSIASPSELADGLPADQDQDQAGLGPSSRSRRSARGSAGIRADGRRQRRVSAGRRRSRSRRSTTVDLMMIEQPLDYDDLVRPRALQAAASHADLPRRVDHGSASRPRTRLRLARAASSTSSRAGWAASGPSLAVHAIAARHGIPLWHGGMLETGIGRAHNLHLSTLPGFTLPGDVAASRRYFVPDLIDPPIEVRPDGCIDVPAGTGHRRHARRRAVRRPRRDASGKVSRVMRGLLAARPRQLCRRSGRARRADQSASASRRRSPAGCHHRPPRRRRRCRSTRKSPGCCASKQSACCAMTPRARRADASARRRTLRCSAAITPDLVGARARYRRRRPPPRRCSAIGRAGLADGVPALVSGLADTDDAVRASAAFALGLLAGQAPGSIRSIAALKDPSALVRGRAADGLGLIGDASRAPARSPTPRRPVATADRRRLRPTTRSRRRRRRSKRAGCRSSRWCGCGNTTRSRASRSTRRASRCRAGGRSPTRCSGSATSARCRRCSDARVERRRLSRRAFALRGLGAAGDQRRPRRSRRPSRARRRRTSACASPPCGRSARSAAPPPSTPLLQLLSSRLDAAQPRRSRPSTRSAASAIRSAFDRCSIELTDPWPSMRAAAAAAAAACESDRLPARRSRASIATRTGPCARRSRATLATLPADRVRGAIADLADDPDAARACRRSRRSRKSARRTWRRASSTALDAPDFAVRATAARLIGRARRPTAARSSSSPPTRGRDSDATVRGAAGRARGARAVRRADAATPTLHEGPGRQGVDGPRSGPPCCSWTLGERGCGCRRGRRRCASRSSSFESDGVAAPGVFAARVHRDQARHHRTRAQRRRMRRSRRSVRRRWRDPGSSTA